MTKPINNDLPAFPIPLHQGESYQGHAPCDGMTLRDYFAAKAMQAILGSPSPNGASSDPDFLLRQVAGASYTVADAMIAERNKRRGEG